MKRIMGLLLASMFVSSCTDKVPGIAESREVSVTIPNAREQKAGFAEAAASGSGIVNNKPEEEDTKNESDSKIPVQKANTQIMHNASAQFQVQDIEKTHQKIAELLKQYNAYFGNDNKTTSTGQVEMNITLRVPAANFDRLLNAVMEESVFTNYRNVTAEDVTDQFVDTETRLKAKKEVELRYLAILKQANKVADILEVEDKLRVIQEEIESVEGRLKLLKDRVSYSTITLIVYQKLDYRPEPEIGFLSKLKEAFVNGWRGFVTFILGVMHFWPFVIIAGVALPYVYRRLQRKKL